MRRLRRICAAVGNSRVKFISCSATVANPLEHFRTIFGMDNVKLVDFDGSSCRQSRYSLVTMFLPEENGNAIEFLENLFPQPYKCPFSLTMQHRNVDVE